MSNEQADQIVALLTEIRDELQRPRLASEAMNRRSRESFAQTTAEQEQRHAREVAAQATVPSARASVVNGIAVIRNVGPDDLEGSPP